MFTCDSIHDIWPVQLRSVHFILWLFDLRDFKGLCCIWKYVFFFFSCDTYTTDLVFGIIAVSHFWLSVTFISQHTGFTFHNMCIIWTPNSFCDFGYQLSVIMCLYSTWQWTPPRHSPLSGSPPAPKWQCSPLMWSHGSVALQSSLNCRAQTLQHPQWSVTKLTPSGHSGGKEKQEHSAGHSHSAWDTTSELKLGYMAVGECDLKRVSKEDSGCLLKTRYNNHTKSKEV